jgi:formylglycine-generating enzyme required for sulfatase activity
LAAVATVLVGTFGAAAGIKYQRSVQSQAHVSIDTGTPGTPAEVYVRTWGHDRRVLAPGTLMGTAPIADHALPAGPYRFVVVGEGGAFAEFDATLTAGQMLARTVAPTATVTAGSEMFSFESGPYTVRVVNPDGTQQDEQIVLDGFVLDISEVSNVQYKEFVDATQYRTPEHWITFGYDEELASRPIMNISFDDAQSYCSWVGKRLPTATEWEAAARSPDGRLYPWGPSEDAPDEVQPSYEALVNSQSRDISVQYPEYRLRTRDVDSGVGVHTANGLRQLGGNVMELTGSPDLMNPNGVVGMGGSWLNHPKYSDLRWTFQYPRRTGSLMIGFRCARGSCAKEAIGKE